MNGQAKELTPAQQRARWEEELCLLFASLSLEPNDSALRAQELAAPLNQSNLVTHPMDPSKMSSGAAGGSQDDSSSPPPSKIFKFHKWSPGRRVAVPEVSVPAPRLESVVTAPLPRVDFARTACEMQQAINRASQPGFLARRTRVARHPIQTPAHRRQADQDAPLDLTVASATASASTSSGRKALKRKLPGDNNKSAPPTLQESVPELDAVRAPRAAPAAPPAIEQEAPPPPLVVEPSPPLGVEPSPSPLLVVEPPPPQPAEPTAPPQPKEATPPPPPPKQQVLAPPLAPPQVVEVPLGQNEPLFYSAIVPAISQQQPPRMDVLWNGVPPSPTAPAYQSNAMFLATTQRNRQGPVATCEFCRLYCGPFAHQGEWKKCPYPFHCPDQEVHDAFVAIFNSAPRRTVNFVATLITDNMILVPRGFTFLGALRPTLSSFPGILQVLERRHTSTFQQTLLDLARVVRPLLTAFLQPECDLWGHRVLRVPVEPLTILAPTMTGFEMAALIRQIGPQYLVHNLQALKNFYLRNADVIADLVIVSVKDQNNPSNSLVVHLRVTPKVGPPLELFADLYQFALQSPNIDSLVPYLQFIGNNRASEVNVTRRRFGRFAPTDDLLLQRRFLRQHIVSRKIVEVFIHHPPNQLPRAYGYCRVPFATIILCFPDMTNLPNEAFENYVEYYFRSRELSTSLPAWTERHTEHPLKTMTLGVYKKIKYFKTLDVAGQRDYLKFLHDRNSARDRPRRQPSWSEVSDGFDVPEAKLTFVSLILYLATLYEATDAMPLRNEKAMWVYYLDDFKEAKANMKTVDTPLNPLHRSLGRLWSL